MQMDKLVLSRSQQKMQTPQLQPTQNIGIHALEDNISAWEGYEDWAAWDL